MISRLHPREKNRLAKKESQDEENVRQAICKEQTEVNELIEENQTFNKLCEKLYAELLQKVRERHNQW